MAQNPLNPEGGSAAVVVVKLPDADVSRLLAMAARRRVRRSALIREALARGLDQLERADTGPPGDGGGET
jgi:predicted transcriptional regulator